jgi:hypothetical protein
MTVLKGHRNNAANKIPQVRNYPRIKPGDIFTHLNHDSVQLKREEIISQIAGLIASAAEPDPKLAKKRLEDSFKIQLRYHGRRGFQKAGDHATDEQKAKAAKLVDEFWPHLKTDGGTIRVTMHSICLGTPDVENLIALDVVGALGADQEVSGYTAANFKIALKEHLEQYGVDGLDTWKTGLDDEVQAFVRGKAEETARHLLPFMYEGTVPPAAEVAVTAEEATPEVVEATPEEVLEGETRTVEEIQAALKDAGIEFRKKATKVELAGLAAAAGV